jgi:hypothetical protein
MNLLEALDDRNLFAELVRDPRTFVAWRAFLAVLFGLPLDDEARAIARTCTGLAELPEGRAFYEAWLVCGPRAGKSFTMAVCAVYLACFKD